VTIAPEFPIQSPAIPGQRIEEEVVPVSADLTVWVLKDTNRPASAEPTVAEAACDHSNEVAMRIDPDEIGEPDFIPTRAVVCIGCEAVRWLAPERKYVQEWPEARSITRSTKQ